MPASQLRHTLQNEPAAEARIAQDLSRLAAGVDSEVGDALRGLWLVNAFARAEGAVVLEQGEPHAADPGYELLAIFARRAERQQLALDAIARTWSRLLHARVSIFALSVSDLAHVPASRFWFHVARGQLAVLSGSPAMIRRLPLQASARPFDSDEPAHVLAGGLVGLALGLLRPGLSKSQLAARAHAAVLAVGDSILLERGGYADTLAARARALDERGTSAALRSLYREAIGQLGHPDAFDPTPGWLERTQRALCRVHLDAATHQHRAPRELLDYVRAEQPVCTIRSTPALAMRTRVAELLPDRLLPQDAARAPLERLLRAAAGLAFGHGVPAVRDAAAAVLRVPYPLASDLELANELSFLAHRVLGPSLREPFASWSLPAPGALVAPQGRGLLRRVRRRFGFVL